MISCNGGNFNVKSKKQNVWEVYEEKKLKDCGEGKSTL
jgi:hypothetical protein